MLGLAACGSKFRSYDGPEVTQLLVVKSERRLYLLHNAEVLKTYDIGLGFAPSGHKQYEGDGRTPEGMYFIDRRNPSSKYHLSVGVSYPNEFDRALASELGKRPGGDIFIHGRGPSWKKTMPKDWTAGCIAVDDRDIEQIYAMVQDGTPILIRP
ncbi:ErfK/YbiS/YcfS/YnhG [Oceaniovalibus guishaninsula JLT2003]|uniref:ErfK/YbiS/YcfS/YnhG n=2 Tax=Oceaniovalibus TaxID=1207070 RepID=K2HP71_9RHOB|nr:ErfK/YbiS/YcfS/YnhG [Oceaniovalibus guishaninsula JLT2003]